MGISETIRELRESNHLSRKEFAAAVGVHPYTVAEWERGNAEPSVPKLSFLRFQFGRAQKTPEITGETLRELREIRGLTLNAFAASIGVTPKALTRWERGETAPSPSKQLSLQRLFAQWREDPGAPARRDTPEPVKPQSFRDGIKQLREMNGLPPDEFAEAAGVHPLTVKNWECGKSFPSASMMARLAGRFGVTAKWLRGCDGKEKSRWVNGPDTTGARLKKLRESAGLSATAFGRLTGAGMRAVLHWENGYCVPGPAKLAAITEYFGVTPEWILEGAAGSPPKVQTVPKRAPAGAQSRI
jgi:transcriptional regulator with XRE-family HTH domain